ncbi:hypothetical protein NEMBOFW57_004618 [Staphylotrichum longicolle]|uniref:Protein kinase domain-containing protein n=1 Tax=Staphylotrichum longicolle TaxID=669026 RepID=A0AAD4I6U0_9PEZI|nr:hypothetical protein NEMBOFW57_004618 [Staphylotrichum longicolle]
MNPLSVISDLETCYKYGKLLVGFCQRWKDAEDELADRATAVELCWLNTSAQLKLVEMMHPVLNVEVRRIFDDSVAVLARKLDLATVQVQKLQDPSSSRSPGFLHFRSKARRAKFAVYQTTLDTTIQDLEAWQVRCKIALDLNMRDPTPSSTNASKLCANPNRPNSLDPPPAPTPTPTPPPPTRSPSPTASAPPPTHRHPTLPAPAPPPSLPVLPGTTKPRHYILDTLPCRPSMTDVRALSDDVRALALKLRRADPHAFGLLNCKGAMRVFARPAAEGAGAAGQVQVVGFEVVFNVPGGADAARVKSLRGALLESASRRDGNGNGNGGLGEGVGAPSLSRRVRLAQELATSVSYVHTFKFVHKNICPESVLLFQEVEGDAQVDRGTGAVVASSRRSSFLIGFESFRSAIGETSLLGDGDWARNIYRHPDRMGEFPAEEYRMQHDIYSLGVCLLEIGLWEPLVEYAGWDDTSEPEYGRVCRDFVGTNKPWVFFKDYLVELAERELPQRMGDRYAEVVVTCLTCLDRDGNFGDESEVADADGILVGVRFIETIFGQLKEIVL